MLDSGVGTRGCDSTAGVRDWARERACCSDWRAIPRWRVNTPQDWREIRRHRQAWAPATQLLRQLLSREEEETGIVRGSGHDVLTGDQYPLGVSVTHTATARATTAAL